MSLRFVILYGSVREARQGIKAARFIVDQLARRGHSTNLIDPLEQRLPLLDRMYKEYTKGNAPAALEALAETYRAADGFVVVSGEYNNGIPPALKKFARFFPRRVFLSAFSDRLLFRRLWRRTCRDAIAHDLKRARHAEHSLDFPDTPCARRVRRRRPSQAAGLGAAGWPVSRRIRMVRRSTVPSARAGYALLTGRNTAVPQEEGGRLRDCYSGGSFAPREQPGGPGPPRGGS